MTPIADMVERLLAAGADPKVIVIAIRGAEESAAAQTAKRRAKDAERQQRKRGRDLFDAPEQDVVVDQTVETQIESRDSRDTAPPTQPPKKEVPTPLRKTTFSELPSGSSSKGASAPPANLPMKVPIYSDSKHELWGEGVPILVQLGLKEREARSNIGRWLRDCADDAASVLGAIQRARDNRIIDPIPWVTQALKTPANVIKFATGEANEASRIGHRQPGGRLPRPGSREDTREQLVRHLAGLRERVRDRKESETQADDRARCGGIGGPAPAQLPKPECA